MASDKKFTPKEAAIAVLQKAEQMYKASTLAKGDWAKIHSKLKREGYSEESADKIDGAIKAKMGKSEKPLEKKYEGFKAVEESAAKSGASDPKAVAAAVGMKKYGKKAFEEHAHEGKKFKKAEDGSNPDEKADADLGEKVEQEVERHEEQNEAPEHKMKGHIKLAKFMGAMEQKRGTRAK